MAVGSSGNLYVADTTDNIVALVAGSPCSSACPFGLAATSVGDIYAVAGTGTACGTHSPSGCGYTSAGAAQRATSAELDAPGDVATDASGNLYISDTTDDMVALVARSACSSACPFGLAATSVGDIYAVAGTGTACTGHTPADCGYSTGGVGQVATSANLDNPAGLAVDNSGDLFVADATNQMVAMVAGASCASACPLALAATTLGDIYAIAGTGTAGYNGDGGGAATTALYDPTGVAVDSSGDVFIADTDNHRVRMVPAASGSHFGQAMTRGDIYTVAGTGAACATHSPLGCGYINAGGSAQVGTAAELDDPDDVAVDSSGDLFIADTLDSMVAMVAGSACSSGCPFGLAATVAGDIYDLAGTGTVCTATIKSPTNCGWTSAGAAQAATAAKLHDPAGVGVDSSGNLYIADTTDNMVALVARSACSSVCPFGLASLVAGDIYDVAGSGTAAYWGDGGTAASTSVDAPGGVAVDSSGDVFIADTSDNRVRMVPRITGTYFGQAMTGDDIYTVAGSGTVCPTHSPAGCGYTAAGVAQLATVADLDAPGGVAVDSSGNLYIADTTDNMVALVARSACSSGCPFGLASTAVGDIYDLAGTGALCTGTRSPATCNYNAAGTAAKLHYPGGVAVDSAGNLYIADTADNMVAMVARAACSSSCPFGLATTTVGDLYAVAGTGTACGSSPSPSTCNYTFSGVAQRATSAYLNAPGGVAVDPSGNLYIADTSDNMVALVARSVCSTSCPFGLAATAVGFIYDVAGTGAACGASPSPATCGYSAAGAAEPATTAELNAPGGVALDPSGNLYIADTSDNMVALVAGAACSSSCPFGLAATVAGRIYVVAGTGTACSSRSPAGCDYLTGSGANPATSAELAAPGAVVLDSAGNLYIADTTDNMVALVAASTCSSTCPWSLPSTTAGQIYAISGTGTGGYSGDGGEAWTTAVDAPTGVAVDRSGNLFIADTGNDRVRVVPASSGTLLGQAMTEGDIYTIAGNGDACLSGSLVTCSYQSSGGAALPAVGTFLNAPAALAVDSSGNIYIANPTDDIVAMVAAVTCSNACPLGLASTTAGDIYSVAGIFDVYCSSGTQACGDTLAPSSAELDDPTGVAVVGAGAALYIADKTDRRVREVLSAPSLLGVAPVAFSGTLTGKDTVLSSVLTVDVLPSTYSVAGAQWSFTITSTTFVNGAASLPAAATTISSPTSSCDASFSCTMASAVAGDPSSYPVTVPAGSAPPTAVTFFSDKSGTGPQTMSFPVQISVPADAKAGTYTSTWTITAQTGP